jgi:hypothetical protein
MRIESERPQGREDVLTLIGRLRQIEHATPKQEPACRHLLGKLLPYAGRPVRPGGPATSSAAPSR